MGRCVGAQVVAKTRHSFGAVIALERVVRLYDDPVPADFSGDRRRGTLQHPGNGSKSHLVVKTAFDNNTVREGQVFCHGILLSAGRMTLCKDTGL